MFMSLVILTEQSEETMIFSKCVASLIAHFINTDSLSLLRLRQELTKLIEMHTEKLGDASAKARTRSALYEVLLQGLNVRTDDLLSRFV